MIDDAVDRLFVAGNDARGKHHRVPWLDLGVLVVLHRGARERRHGLALRAADQDRHLVGSVVLDLAGMNDEPRRRVDVPEVLRDLGGLRHGAPHQRDLAVVLGSHLHRQLDAMNGRGKARDKKAVFGSREDVLETRAHRPLAGGVSLPLDIGRVLKERQHAAFAVLGKGMQIEEAIVRGRGIDLEVAGMNQDSQRRVDGQRDAIHQAVRHLDGLDGEGPDAKRLPGADFVQHGVVEQPVLVQLVLDVGQGELGAVDRDVQLREQPGNGADVVLVPVRQNQGANMIAVLDEIADIRHDDVDAEQLRFGEHQSGVDHDDVVAPAHGHAVHSKFAATA